MKQNGKDARTIDQELISRARATRSIADRDALILGSMFLVTMAVGAFAAKYDTLRYFRDDLEAAGQVALVEVIDVIISRDDIDDPTGYTKTAIWNGMLDACKQAESIRCPVKLFLDEEQTEESRDKLPPPRIDKRVSSHEIEYCSGDDLRRRTALLEEIELLCATDEERAIVGHLAAGLLPNEVATQMGCHLATVYRVRQRLADRFDNN